MPGQSTKYLRINSTDNFLDTFDPENKNNQYVFIGHVTPWDDENNPPTPDNNVQYIDYDIWNSMIAAKKILTADVTHAIPRYDWSANTVYRMYDSDDTELYSKPENSNTFFVVTDDDNVYKVLFNNYGTPSTIKPTGTSTAITATNDGYLWKYMYTISSADATKFKKDNVIPIETLSANNGSAQWEVQQAASNGSIDVVLVENTGNNYLTNEGSPQQVNSSSITLANTASATDAAYEGYTVFINSGKGVSQIREITSYTGSNRVAVVNSDFVTTPNTSSTYLVGPKVTIKGNGTGATAYANVDSGSVNHVNMISTGQNYSYANAIITTNNLFGDGATARPIISPPRGHGSDAISELGGYNAILNVELDGSEGNTFTTNNDFRTVGLLRNPLLANNDTANNAAYNQTTRLTVTSINGSGFVNDTQVRGQTTDAVAYIVNFANTNATSTQGILSIVDVSNGYFDSSENIISNNDTTATITDIQTGDLKKYSGDVLYVNNRQAVERSDDQTENITLVFKF